MDENADGKLYRPEPIPHRPQRTGAARSSRTPMNGSRADAREAIERIRTDERFRSAARSTAKRPAAPPDIVEASRRLANSLERISAAIGNARENRSMAEKATDSAARAAGNLFSNNGGHQQPFELPDRYREMRAISRWQEGASDKPGRWLTEAELFYRQGTFMADWEDDCPYNGLFKSYFPTYNAMSDRQLRGYFTWRAAVRKGDVQETSLSFAYVYLYELINGIGVAGPLEGFHKIETFWQAYRNFAPELDRYANVWLQDYAVYHGLDSKLLASRKTVVFDRALIALRDADAEMAGDAGLTAHGSHARRAAAETNRVSEMPFGEGAQGATLGATGNSPSPASRRRKRGEPTIPLPPDTAREERLFAAIDALSTYRLSNSRLFKEHPDALRHVACAVYVRMSEHHRKQRKNSLLESWFGEEVTLPYTMFGSAVFFEPARHPDTMYELDEIHRYRCERGLWTCERFHGNRTRSPKLGAAMRAVDRGLRLVLDPKHPLKDDEKTPKYLQKFIDQEIEAWSAWSAAHAPVHIDIDLSQLAGIRSAAAETREALLIDEEREDDEAAVEVSPAKAERTAAQTTDGDTPSSAKAAVPETPHVAAAPAQQSVMKYTFSEFSDPLKRINLATLSDGMPHEADGGSKDSRRNGRDARVDRETSACPTPSAPDASSPLSPSQSAYLRALVSGNAAAASAASRAAGTSEDLLVDAINEALFDQVGDTVIEYGPDGTPQLIEDYREDVEGILNHE